MSAVPPRDLAPFLRKIRNLLLGRDYKNALRFQDKVATRSPPPPNLPDGPSHKLSQNYYFTRDARHEVRPPVALILASQRAAISAGSEKALSESAATKKLGLVVPGKPYVWKPISQNKEQ